jgi:phosphatidylglycerol lysyltransferase
MKHGWNAVAYQVLNPGFEHWFSPEGDAVAGYVRRAGRWVVAGAPICAPDRLPLVIEQLEADARADGCRVCYFGAAVRLYEGCKNPPRHSVVTLGSQPVWDPTDWGGVIQRKASVRAQILRAQNKHVVVSESKLPTPADFVKLQQLLDDWLRSRAMPPMHFLVEPGTLGLLADRRLFVALQGETVVGFLVASPIPCRNGWLVEQIIRHSTSPNGTNELLLHHAMLAFAKEQAGYVTLGLVPLAQNLPVDAQENPLWLALLFKWVRAHGRRFYNFAGLEAFKSKFRPTKWEPIYAISTEARFTPRTLWTIGAAFSHHRSPVLHGGLALAMALKQEVSRGTRFIRNKT